MRFLLCILAVILTYQSVNAQSLWRNSATTNRVPWLVSGYTNIVGTLTNPITTAGAISSTGGFTSAVSNYFGTVQSTNILDPSNVKYWGAKGDGVTDDTASISNAIAALTNGGTLYFPAGTYSNRAPINITTKGLSIVGDAPQVLYVTNAIPDTSLMTPAGGTWFDFGGTNGFTGHGLRGMMFENIGVKNFWKAFSFGGDGVEGVNFGTFRNIIGLGDSTINRSEIGIENYNGIFLRIDAVKFYAVNTGLRLVQQGDIFQCGNSVISDFYTFTYPKAATNGNSDKAGIEVLSKVPAGGAGRLQNMITFLRPQVNSFNGDGTGVGIRLLGESDVAAVANISLIDTDVEGPLRFSFYSDFAYFNTVKVATAAASQPGYLYIGTNSYGNFVDSSDPGTVITNVGPSRTVNKFTGVFAPTSTTNDMVGMYRVPEVNKLIVKADFVQGQISSDASGYTSPNVAGTGTASYHPGGLYATGGNSYLNSTITDIGGILNGPSAKWQIYGDTYPTYFSGNNDFTIGASVSLGAKLGVLGDIRASTTITATNGFFLPTQTAPPVVAGGGTLWNSNSVLYWVTATKTNMVSDGR